MYHSLARSSPEFHRNLTRMSPELHHNFAGTSHWSTSKKGIATTRHFHTPNIGRNSSDSKHPTWVKPRLDSWPVYSMAEVWNVCGETQHIESQHDWQPRYTNCLWYNRGTTEVHPRYNRGTTEVHQLHGHRLNARHAWWRWNFWAPPRQTNKKGLRTDGACSVNKSSTRRSLDGTTRNSQIGACMAWTASPLPDTRCRPCGNAAPWSANQYTWKRGPIAVSTARRRICVFGGIVCLRPR